MKIASTLSFCLDHYLVQQLSAAPIFKLGSAYWKGFIEPWRLRSSFRGTSRPLQPRPAPPSPQLLLPPPPCRPFDHRRTRNTLLYLTLTPTSSLRPLTVMRSKAELLLSLGQVVLTMVPSQHLLDRRRSCTGGILYHESVQYFWQCSWRHVPKVQHEADYPSR